VSLSRVREENVLAPYVVIAHGFKYYVRRFPKRGIFAVDKILLVFWPETTLSLKLRVLATTDCDRERPDPYNESQETALL
jgi:hypothetical protein